MQRIYPLNMEGYSKTTRWCGPSAVAILTGQPLTATTEILTRIHGGTYDELSGVWPEDTILALHELGYRAQEIDIQSRYPDLTHGPTLERFVGDRTVTETVTPMLIEISGHFLVAHYGYLADNWVQRPTPIGDFPKLRRLVKSAWLITEAPR